MNVGKGEICETGWIEKKFCVLDGREGREKRDGQDGEKSSKLKGKDGMGAFRQIDFGAAALG
jgi:hypothetical protein